MIVFRYDNQNKQSFSGEKIGLFYGIFSVIAAVIFFLVFDPSNFAALVFLGLIIVGMILMMVIWLRHAQKVETVYVLDEQGILWQLFMQSDASAHISSDVVLRIESLHIDFPATGKPDKLNQDDSFIMAVVRLCQENPQMKKTFYQGGSIIKEMHKPILMSSYDSTFIVQFIDEKGQQKEIKIPHNYVGLEQVLKNNQ